MVCRIAIGSILEAEVEIQSEAREIVSRMSKSASGLQKLLKLSRPRTPSLSDLKTAKKCIPGHIALGRLKAAEKFLAKCLRDAPDIEDRGGVPITEEQRTKIDYQLQMIMPEMRVLHRTLAKDEASRARV